MRKTEHDIFKLFSLTCMSFIHSAVRSAFQCSCSGTTKRRIQCYDIGLRKPSSNCVDAQKPLSRQQCTPPPNCSCRTLQQRKNVRTNGEYVLNVRGKPVRIYCHDMNTVQPKEYITLQQNLNYAMYYDRRALDRRQCPRSERDMYADDSLPSGTTHFQKVRLDLHGLRVVEDDYQFARVSGARQQPFGSAGDCLSEVTGCVQGRFVISFVGTRFRMRSDTRWEVSTNATMAFSERVSLGMVFLFCFGDNLRIACIEYIARSQWYISSHEPLFRRGFSILCWWYRP